MVRLFCRNVELYFMNSFNFRIDKPAPEISIDYWRLSPDAKMLDVLYAVRSDETTHRFVNHSLANLNTATDVNPFAIREPNMLVKGKKIESVIFSSIWRDIDCV